MTPLSNQEPSNIATAVKKEFESEVKDFSFDVVRSTLFSVLIGFMLKKTIEDFYGICVNLYSGHDQISMVQIVSYFALVVYFFINSIRYLFENVRLNYLLKLRKGENGKIIKRFIVFNMGLLELFLLTVMSLFLLPDFYTVDATTHKKIFSSEQFINNQQHIMLWFAILNIALVLIDLIWLGIINKFSNILDSRIDSPESKKITKSWRISGWAEFGGFSLLIICALVKECPSPFLFFSIGVLYIAFIVELFIESRQNNLSKNR